MQRKSRLRKTINTSEPQVSLQEHDIDSKLTIAIIYELLYPLWFIQSTTAKPQETVVPSKLTSRKRCPGICYFYQLWALAE